MHSLGQKLVRRRDGATAIYIGVLIQFYYGKFPPPNFHKLTKDVYIRWIDNPNFDEWEVY